MLPIGFGLLIVAVAIAQGLREEPAIQRFIQRYPETIEPVGNDAATTGFLRE
jgi:sulfoxide reductase catalytic subunit YedY